MPINIKTKYIYNKWIRNYKNEKKNCCYIKHIFMKENAVNENHNFLFLYSLVCNFSEAVLLQKSH